MYRIFHNRSLYGFLYVALGALSACSTEEGFGDCHAIIWERGAKVTVQCYEPSEIKAPDPPAGGQTSASTPSRSEPASFKPRAVLDPELHKPDRAKP